MPDQLKTDVKQAIDKADQAAYKAVNDIQQGKSWIEKHPFIAVLLGIAGGAFIGFAVTALRMAH